MRSILDYTDALPADVRRIMEAHPGALALAGGFVRDVELFQTPKDVDLFLLRPDDNDAIMRDLFAATRGKGKDETGHGNALTWAAYPYPIQLVRGPWRNAREVLATFDFTICQVALMYTQREGWHLITTSGYDDAIVTKTLRHTGKQMYPGSSLRRLVKFAARGLEVPPETLRGVAEAMGVTDPDVLNQIEHRGDS